MDPFNKNLNQLNLKQRIWHAELLISTILADGLVKTSEIAFMKDVIVDIGDETEKIRLINLLKENHAPQLRLPENIDKEILASIFVELIEICISDLELAENEQKLLKSVSNLFNFTDSYYKKLMQWCNEGLEWKNSRLEIIPKIQNEGLLVPVKSLNTDQKKWYIDIMVSTLMIAGIRDSNEKNLLKIMLSSTQSKQEQNVLKQHVLQRHRPPLKRPPTIHQEILNRIFVEIVTIFISYGSMSYLEQQHIKQVSDICRMPTQIFTKILDWGHQGILWKKNKQILLDTVKINRSEEEEIAMQKGLLVQHPKINSLQIRKVECFVCESKTQINAFQVKPHSHELTYNIFGDQTYLRSNEGYDYSDFNHLKVIVCPACLFASPDITNFFRNNGDEPPEELKDVRFKELWIENIDQRKEKFGKSLETLTNINRPVSAIINSYQQAIDIMHMIAKRNDDESKKLQEIDLLLNMAQFFASIGDEEKADEKIIDARTICEDIYNNSKLDSSIIFCTRILIIISLYLGEGSTAKTYYDYLVNFKKEHYYELDQNTKADFVKVFDETSEIITKTNIYNKDSLSELHLKI